MFQVHANKQQVLANKYQVPSLMATCTNCQNHHLPCVQETATHVCDFCRKAKRRCSLISQLSDRRRPRAASPSSRGNPPRHKRPRTSNCGNSLDNFMVPDSASVSIDSCSPSPRVPTPPQPSRRPAQTVCRRFLVRTTSDHAGTFWTLSAAGPLDTM
jgi:hypothetical protein